MRIRIPYKPRPLQAAIHQGRRRHTLLITHRRFGKTVFAVCELLRRALRHGNTRGNWRAGYIAPYLKQAKGIAWDYLKFFAGTIPGARFHETELRLDLPNAARVRLYGADNPDALRGLYFDDLVIDEAADVPRSVWSLVLRPALADRRGWALFMGTPRGANNLLADMRDAANKDPDNWASFIFTASETGYVEAEELAGARAAMTGEEYEQEFECSFAAAVRGALYAKELDAADREGRVGLAPYEPELAVSTAWDLDMDDATAIWFFQTEPSGGVRILEYYENSGEGLEHYIGFVLGKGHRYARHIAPHDIMVRELGTGKSRLETARLLGLSFTPCRNLPVADGINAVRRLLPRCRFDASRCAEGLRAIRQYQKTWNETMGVFGKPLHNWTSHAADAFRNGQNFRLHAGRLGSQGARSGGGAEKGGGSGVPQTGRARGQGHERHGARRLVRERRACHAEKTSGGVMRMESGRCLCARQCGNAPVCRPAGKANFLRRETGTKCLCPSGKSSSPYGRREQGWTPSVHDRRKK